MAIANFNQEKKIEAGLFGKIIFYLLFILIIPIFYYIKKRNDIIRTEVKINEADSGIDVQLTKRKEALEKIIASVKQTMKFEKDVLTQITQLRTMNTNKSNMDEKILMNETMDTIQGKINIQLENYPDLKSNTAVVEMQKAIKDIENDLAASRRIYNANVSSFNRLVQSWPGNIPAQSLNVWTKPFFEASQVQKQDVVIDLGV